MVSTHMPLTRHDKIPLLNIQGNMFLLTCLLRGMTDKSIYCFVSSSFLLTCLLRGMTTMPGKPLPSTWFLLTCLLRGMTGLPELHRQRKQFLLTCLLRGMTYVWLGEIKRIMVSTHMPLTRHDFTVGDVEEYIAVSTHMPLTRHDCPGTDGEQHRRHVSTHMPLTRHDRFDYSTNCIVECFYSHASYEA